MSPENEERKHFHELAADFDNAVLVTQTPGGELHARPMAVAELGADGRAYFATALDSPKVAELEADPHAVAVFQDKRQFATLAGTVRVSRDRQLIDRLWADDWEIWFPGGKADPKLCILILEGRQGEYWDRAGAEAISYAFELVGATLEGKRDIMPKEQHSKVNFEGNTE
jgi:general stress protein 26